MTLVHFRICFEYYTTVQLCAGVLLMATNYFRVTLASKALSSKCLRLGAQKHILRFYSVPVLQQSCRRLRWFSPLRVPAATRTQSGFHGSWRAISTTGILSELYVCACVCVQCAMYNLHMYLFPASSLYNGKYVYTPDPAIALPITAQYE